MSPVTLGSSHAVTARGHVPLPTTPRAIPGIRQTPRQQRRYAARLDATAAEVVRLTSALEHARRMLRAAQEREART